MSRKNNRRRDPAAREPYFPCAGCGRAVANEAHGTQHRNHCPHCLCSLHVDIRVGDRRSGCRGVMEPICIWVRDDGEVALVHRCARCGKLNLNRIAGDDDEASLKELALQPLRRFALG